MDHIMCKVHTYMAAALSLGVGHMLPFEPAHLFAQTPRTRNLIQTRPVKEDESTDSGTMRTNVVHSRFITLYRRHCIDCHDSDGQSASAREIMSHAPDFTDPQWHRAHGDFELAHVIWEGRKPMPAMKGKLAMKDVDGLVLLVRGFRGGNLEVPEDPGTRGDGDDPGNAPQPPLSPSVLRPQPAVSPPSGSLGANSNGAPAAIPLTAQATFQRLCTGCHGSDGDGSPLRVSTPSIPDFALRDWQEKRTNGALTVSILEGKGRGMPPFGDKFDATGAQELVTYVRSLAGLRTDQSQELHADFNLRFQQLMAEMEALKRDYRALSHDDPFAPSTDRVPPVPRPFSVPLLDWWSGEIGATKKTTKLVQGFLR
jgi:mono/diheme cytochrome c family protein